VFDVSPLGDERPSSSFLLGIDLDVGRRYCPPDFHHLGFDSNKMNTTPDGRGRQVTYGYVQADTALFGDREDRGGAADVDERRGATSVERAVSIRLLSRHWHPTDDATRGGLDDGEAAEGQGVEADRGRRGPFVTFVTVDAGAEAGDEGLGEDASCLWRSHRFFFSRFCTPLVQCFSLRFTGPFPFASGIFFRFAFVRG